MICVIFFALCIYSTQAACPNGLPDNVSQSMLNFVQRQFGQAYTWDCTLETQASKNSSSCSFSNSGAANGSLKFSLPLSAGTSGSGVVMNHFQMNAGSQSIPRTTSASTVGCGYAECDKRVDIVCLFKNSSQ